MAKNRPTLASRIKLLRYQYEYTQERLAEAANMPLQSVINIEYGKRTDPRLSTLMKLSEAFGITIDELVFGKQKK